MQMSGKLVIIAIFGAALAGGVATLWFQYDARRRSREFWGTDTAVLISRAPKVELLRLSKAEKADEDTERLMIDGDAYEISERKDISKARGFVHVRDALIRDTGFAWEKVRGDCQPNWVYAFRFKEEDKTEDVVFDFACERVRLVSGEREACISPMMQGIKDLIERELPDEKKIGVE